MIYYLECRLSLVEGLLVYCWENHFLHNQNLISFSPFICVHLFH